MRAFQLGSMGLVLILAASTSSCDKVAECAGLTCKGSIAEGSLEITGNVQIDGVLRGVGAISTAVAETKGAIEAEVRGMCQDLGLADCSGDLAALTAAVNAELGVRFQTAGSLTVVTEPAKCEASVEVAVEATARCDVTVDPGSVQLSCEGTCSGSCSGGCTGDLSCEVRAPSIACSGSCEGSCNLEAGGACEGTCNGQCDGDCTLVNAEGECRGQCGGNCTGSCELTVAASCSGTCSGKCFVDQGAAECTGEVSCHGSCDASCSGGCEGSVTPPSASAECQAAARAEASASLHCTPPSVTIDFTFGGDAEAEARLTGAVATVKTHLPGILAAIAKLGMLVDGEGSAAASLSVSVGALAQTEIDLDPALIACLIEQLPDAVDRLDSAISDGAASLSAAVEVSTCATGSGC